MDIERIVEELRAERDRLNGIITALERLNADDEGIASPKRRGRKFMDKQGRREVSERMKRYWAERRTARSVKNQEQAESAAAANTSEKSDRASSSDSTCVIAA